MMWKWYEGRTVLAGALAAQLCAVALGQSTVTNIDPSKDFGTSSPAIQDLNGDGFAEIIVVSTEWGVGHFVRVYNGATNYASQLPGDPGWPQLIREDTLHGWISPTVAIGDINFDGALDVLVGGLLNRTNDHVRAFQANGKPVPGWEAVSAAFPPFLNAPSFGDVNADGAPNLLVADESTYLQRFGPLGDLRQCQLVADPVHSSPAFGDVGGPGGSHLADGIPDEIIAGDGKLEFGGGVYRRAVAYDSFEHTLSCGGEEDTIFRFGPFVEENRGYYYSSPALADLDGIDAMDMVITQGLVPPANSNGRLIVFASALPGIYPPVHAISDFLLPSGGPLLVNPAFSNDVIEQYSSPAILDLDNDGIFREIVVAADDGKLRALRYDPSLPPAARLVDDLPDWAGGVALASAPSFPGTPAASGSPTAMDITGDGYQEIVVGNDAGNVSIVDRNGEVLETISLRDGEWSEDAAIWGAVAIGQRQEGDPPMLVAGNRHGLFVIQPSLPGAEPEVYVAQWPTFHRDNARSGALPFPVTPTHGSIGGFVPECVEDFTVEVLDVLGNPPNFELGDTADSVSDGRYVFEQVPPAVYFVKFDQLVIPVAVVAGEMAFVDACLGDVNCDGEVDTFDFIIANASYPACQGQPGFVERADIDRNGCVDVDDILFILTNQGPCP